MKLLYSIIFTSLVISAFAYGFEKHEDQYCDYVKAYLTPTPKQLELCK